MIEIELKLEVENFPNFKDYQCVKEKHIVDVYYDTSIETIAKWILN